MSSVPDGVSFHAGFPNAAEGAATQALSLDALMVTHPASTFFWCLQGNVPDTPWKAGDILVVDRATPPKANDWVVALIDEDFLLCNYRGKQKLFTASGEQIQSETRLWGVITYVVQPLRGQK